MFKRLISYVNEFSYWIKKGILEIIGTLSFFILIIFLIYQSFVGFSGKSYFVWGGCFLQLIGAYMTIYCMDNILIHFKKSHLYELPIIWWKEMPKWKQKEIIGSINVSMPPPKFNIQGSFGIVVNPDQPVEDRIAALEKNFEVVKNILPVLCKDSAEMKNELLDHKKEVGQQNEKMENKFNSI